MKFKLETSGYLYKDTDREKLSKLGFEFEPHKFMEYQWKKKENINLEIEINSLDQLVEFMGKWGSLILSPDTIEIYDDYKE